MGSARGDETQQQAHDDTATDRAERATEDALEALLDRFTRTAHLSTHQRAARVLLPVALLVAGALSLSLLYVGNVARLWIFLGIYFVPGGIEAGIPAGIALGVHPVVIASSIIYANMVGGLFLYWNLDLLFRIPRLGPRLARTAHRAAEKWHRHERFERLGLVGLAAYVALPISLSGVIPGTLIGRLLGFPPGLVWVAVTSGAVVRIVAFTAIAAGLFAWLF